MVITFITYFKSSLKKFIDSMDVMEPHWSNHVNVDIKIAKKHLKNNIMLLIKSWKSLIEC